MVRRHAARQVTARDLALCYWTGLSGIAAEEQLIRRFWPSARPQTARDRLAQLVKAGYLAAQLCDVRQPGEMVYTLTATGRLLFAKAQRPRLHVGLPAAQEIRQQLLAQDAYLRLEAEAAAQGGRLVDWRSERELRGAFRLAEQAAAREHQAAPTWEIADAQAVICDAAGQEQALDVEIDGAYYGKMLRNKAARFGQSGRPTVWVCEAARAPAVQKATAAYANIRVLVVEGRGQ